MSARLSRSNSLLKQPTRKYEGTLWGSVVAHGLLKDAVIVSDDAGQFNVGSHALCWVHAERLIHKLVGFNHRQRQACARIRARVGWFYADLWPSIRIFKPCRLTPAGLFFFDNGMFRRW